MNKKLSRSTKDFESFVIYIHKTITEIKFMTLEQREQALNCLCMAIELAGDGGPSPFDDEEYNLMYELINELRN